MVVATDAGACCFEAAAAAAARAGEVREVAGWKSKHLSLFTVGHAALGVRRSFGGRAGAECA